MTVRVTMMIQMLYLRLFRAERDLVDLLIEHLVDAEDNCLTLELAVGASVQHEELERLEAKADEVVVILFKAHLFHKFEVELEILRVEEL